MGPAFPTGSRLVNREPRWLPQRELYEQIGQRKPVLSWAAAMQLEWLERLPNAMRILWFW
jgi:hypothetical protein